MPNHKTKLQTASPTMRAALAATLDAIRPYADELGDQGMIAVLAYTLGQLVALSDQRKLTPPQASELIHANIYQGNTDAIGQVLRGEAGHG